MALVTGGCLGKNMGDGIYLPGGATQQKAIREVGWEEAYLSAGRRISKSWDSLTKSGAVPFGWKPVSVWVRILPDGRFGLGSISSPSNPSEKVQELVARTIHGAQPEAKPLPEHLLAKHPGGAKFRVILGVP